MINRSIQMGVVCIGLLCASTVAKTTDRNGSTPKPADDATVFDLDGVPMEPLAYFEALVSHYRALDRYRDSSHLVQITQRQGEADRRLESNLRCEITDGKLQVITPETQIRRGLGLSVPLRRSEALRRAELRYQLWLAPHMALKYAEKPLDDLREGVEEGFTPTLLERVRVNDRDMVHLELRGGDGLSQCSPATFDFFIDPDSMFIERIECDQRMPDGSRFQTLLEILPELESMEPASAVTG